MTDCKNLDLAREWAEWADKKLGIAESHLHARAAADLILSLPDEWVSTEQLWGVIEDMNASLESSISGDRARGYDAATKAWKGILEALLPAPPKPLTMAEVAWSDEEHHLAEARTRGGQLLVMLSAEWRDGDNTGIIYCSDPDGEVDVWRGSDLTPTGEKYRLEPVGVPEGGPIEIAGDDHASHCASCAEMDDDEPEFDPAYTYLDKDGDVWGINPYSRQWAAIDLDDDGWHIPPAKYGPYNRIEKENDHDQ